MTNISKHPLDIHITAVTQADFEDWLALALKLWPEEDEDDIQDMRDTLTEILQSPREAGFLVRDETGQAIAFINLAQRYEYVPGATQKPVAYVEGIYVEDAHRHQGIGSALIQFAEHWAREQGCIELASDALIENTDSYAFHTQMGFQEVERVVCFIKPLADPKVRV